MKPFLIPLLLTSSLILADQHSPNQEGTRQIHLDFHTSEEITDIGAHFDKEQFQQALLAGNVNAINLFAKGHHGWSYYPTEVGAMHPHLDFDLMGAQIDACREIGVKVKLYFTVGWSVRDAELHPEWRLINKDGRSPHEERIKGRGLDDPLPQYAWYYLPPEGPYVDQIHQQVKEILENYEVDGLWFDIITPFRINYNDWALNDFEAHGVDPTDDHAVFQRHREKYEAFLHSTAELVSRINPEASVFFNGTTANFNSEQLNQYQYEFYRFNSKYDLEDLPTAWGGYDLFPWRSKYFANLDKDIIAMSGKFHKAWGEFGGFKHKDALWYEAATMVAFGANVNIGDQLHPSGIMEMATYESIGHAFEYVEQIERYGIGADHAASTGLYLGGDLSALEGTTRMLLETQVNFNVVNTREDWSEFDVIIITSGGLFEADLAKVRQYHANGGKLLFLGEGFLHNGNPIVNVGADLLGRGNYDIDYTVALPAVGARIVDSPFLNYRAALRLNPHPDTEVLARIHEPFFSRTLRHFSSHANTPYRLEAATHPAAIRKDNVILLAHDLDLQYRAQGMRLHRELFFNGLALLRTDPLVEVELPSMGRINLLHQPDDRRYVLHLLYATPIQRGEVQVIEDLIPLHNIPVSLNLPLDIKRAYLVPSGIPLDLKADSGKVSMVIPEMTGHTAIAIEY